MGALDSVQGQRMVLVGMGAMGLLGRVTVSNVARYHLTSYFPSVPFLPLFSTPSISFYLCRRDILQESAQVRLRMVGCCVIDVDRFNFFILILYIFLIYL
jgi:hypothetical protein